MAIGLAPPEEPQIEAENPAWSRASQQNRTVILPGLVAEAKPGTGTLCPNRWPLGWPPGTLRTVARGGPPKACAACDIVWQLCQHSKC